MLSNAYFLAKFRFDTAENEPAQNLQNFRKMHFRKMHFRKMHFRGRQAEGERTDSRAPGPRAARRAVAPGRPGRPERGPPRRCTLGLERRSTSYCFREGLLVTSIHIGNILAKCLLQIVIYFRVEFVKFAKFVEFQHKLCLKFGNIQFRKFWKK